MRLPLLFTGAVALALALAPIVRAQDAPKPDTQGDDKKADKPAIPDAPDPEQVEKGGMTAEEAATQKFPWNPFEKAVEGDWAVYQGSVHFETPMGPSDKPVTSYWRITKVDDDSVTVESSGSGIGAKRSQKTLKTFARKSAPTLKELFELSKEGKVESLKLEDGKATLEGKEFTGKKISFSSSKGDGKMKTAMWVSPDVKGIGLFRMLMGVKSTPKGEGVGITVKVELHLAGYGNGDKADWGKSYKDVAGDDARANDAPPRDAPAREAPARDAPARDAPKDGPKPGAAPADPDAGTKGSKLKPCANCGELRPADSVTCPHCGLK